MKIFNSLKDYAEPLTTVTSEMLDNILDERRKQGYPISPSNLQKCIGGIRLKSLIILASETNMGKSLISIDLMHSLAKNQGVQCVYLDLENGVEAFIDKLHSRWYEGKKDPDTYQREVQDIANVKYYGLDMIEESVVTLKKKRVEVITSIIEREVAGGLSEVFIIDPLQNVSAETDPGVQMNDEAMIVRKLRDMAQKHNICIIINHHLKKSGGYRNFAESATPEEDKPKYRIPTIEDIIGSSKIANTATDVWAFFRENMALNPKDRGRIYFASRKSRTPYVGKCFLYSKFESGELINLEDAYPEIVYGHKI